jgi:hypothetical protein
MRLLLTQKYVRFNIPSTGNAEDIQYKSNTKLNLGIGAAWRIYSLNLFYGFNFLNKPDDKGKTKGLNLQLQVFPRKWSLTLLALFPKGYHIDPREGLAPLNSNSYYYRPDIKLTLLGLSAYRVPNTEKFSYRSALRQTEWQKKSAGSLLFGGEIYYRIIEGDSALVPKQIQNEFPQAGITKIDIITFGPGIGYAYTLVIQKHFFITASLVTNLDINLVSEQRKTGKLKNTSIGPSAVFKAAAGYNSSDWDISANLTGNATWANGFSATKNYYFPIAGGRIILAKRFNLKTHHTK